MLASRASAQRVAPSSSRACPATAVAAASAVAALVPRRRASAVVPLPPPTPPTLRPSHRHHPHRPSARAAAANQQQQTAAGSRTASGVLARWLFDCRYGTRTEATALLQEWVSSVGAPAGCTPANTRLSAGAVGVPESRLELELSLPSLAAWEDFLARIDRQAHRAWSERAARLMVDGSTRWEVLRAVPVMAAAAAPAPAAVAGAAAPAAVAGAAAPAANASSGGGSLVFTPPGASVEAAAAEARGEPPKPRDPFADALMSALGAGAEGGSRAAAADAAAPPSSSSSDDEDGESSSSSGPAPLLDWKGEPMQLNPGDKLPFKFL